MKHFILALILLSVAGCNLLADKTPVEVQTIEDNVTDTAKWAADAVIDSAPLPGPLKEPVKDAVGWLIGTAVAAGIAALGGKKTYDKLVASEPGKLFGKTKVAIVDKTETENKA